MKTSNVQSKCQGPQLLSPPFLMTSTMKQMRPTVSGVKVQAGLICPLLWMYRHQKDFCFREPDPRPGAPVPRWGSASRLDSRPVVYPTFLDLATPLLQCFSIFTDVMQIWLPTDCLTVYILYYVYILMFRSSTYCTDVQLSCHNKRILLLLLRLNRHPRACTSPTADCNQRLQHCCQRSQNNEMLHGLVDTTKGYSCRRYTR